MAWLKLRGFAALSSPTATLANIDWRHVQTQVWQLALRESGIDSGGSHPADWEAQVNLETWQMIMHRVDVNTIQGLQSYVMRWAHKDSLVLRWMKGSEVCQKPTADIGGWLADYFNTTFLTLSGQAKSSVTYKVVDNRWYHSLAELIGPTGLGLVKAGNVWEQLCWHAFEQGRGAFILACIWNTSNRCLLPAPETVPPPPPPGPAPQAMQETAPPGPPLAPPPRPPPAPPPEHPAGFSQADAAAMRNGRRPPGLHSALRAHLQAVANHSEQTPYQRLIEVPATLPWREYIAYHDKCDVFIGPGIERFYLYFMPQVDRQKSRHGQLRLNYVIERRDGSYILLHPGSKPRNDAQPIRLSQNEFQMMLEG